LVEYEHNTSRGDALTQMQYGALLCVLRITGPFLTGHIDHLNCTLWLRSLGEHVAFCRKEIILPVFDKRCQKEQKENIEGGGGARGNWKGCIYIRSSFAANTNNKTII